MSRSQIDALEPRVLLTTWGAYPTLIHQDLAVQNLPTVDGRGQSFTFLQVKGRGVAIFVTVLTFILAAGAAAGGIALLILNH